MGREPKQRPLEGNNYISCVYINTAHLVSKRLPDLMQKMKSVSLSLKKVLIKTFYL